jgi:hypothetical protein
MEQETIYQALLKTARAADPTFEERKLTETHEQYIYRLLELIGEPSKVTQEMWEAMGTETTAWYNHAAEELTVNHTYVDLPGYPNPNSHQTTSPSTPKPGKKAGIMMTIRQAALKNPDLNWEQLSEKLASEGHDVKPSTVWVCVEEVKNVRKAVVALGGAITLPV